MRTGECPGQTAFHLGVMPYRDIAPCTLSLKDRAPGAVLQHKVGVLRAYKQARAGSKRAWAACREHCKRSLLSEALNARTIAPLQACRTRRGVVHVPTALVHCRPVGLTRSGPYIGSHLHSRDIYLPTRHTTGPDKAKRGPKGGVQEKRLQNRTLPGPPLFLCPSLPLCSQLASCMYISAWRVNGRISLLMSPTRRRVVASLSAQHRPLHRIA